MSSSGVKSLSEFIARVSEHRERWRIEDRKELWFRGEKQKYSTPLCPALYRPKKNASKEDLPLKPISELIDIESELYREFQRCAVQLLDSEPQNNNEWNWDAYFLMQHHLAPTRLLDWSDGALMALHFAVKNKPKDDPTDGEAIVYVLEPYRLMNKLDALSDTQDTKDRWKAYLAKTPIDDHSEDDWDDSYLPADDGCRKVDLPNVPLILDFPILLVASLHSAADLWYLEQTPDGFLKKSQKEDSSIQVITIEADVAYKIRTELRDSGVTESVIYPDLDGLGREMKQLWEDRK